MSVEQDSGNATPPTPAIAPGLDTASARDAARRFASRGMDPRVTAAVPTFDAPFFQAGLAGYSDAAMRLIARRHGCPFCVTEALLDRTLIAGGRGFTKADLGELHDNVPGGSDDHPLACQIMGSDPDEMAAACLKASEQGRQGDKFYRRLAYQGRLSPAPQPNARPLRLPGGEQLDPTEGLGDSRESDSCEHDSCETLIDEINDIEGLGQEPPADAEFESPAPRGSASSALAFETIDVNLACPVKKIKSKARGGHWLAEPDGAIEILAAVRRTVPAHVPCTVKLRRSYDDTPEMAANLTRILDAATDLGYAWATVHARTVVQKYIGPSRWDLLRTIVRRHPRLPIFGSGDIWNAGDIFLMIEYTGVVGAAVARGCIGNPWIFRQARDLLAGRDPRPPTPAEQRAVLEQHLALAIRVNAAMRHPEDATSKQMRKFGIRFSAHHPTPNPVRLAFIAARSLSDWHHALDTFYPAREPQPT